MEWTRTLRTNAPAATIVVRFLVGFLFFLEGIKKFLFVAQMGRRTLRADWDPASANHGPFVGAIEIVFGFLLLVGLVTRLASLLLLIDISVAIASTKIPLLLRSGFWPMEAEARTDYAMLLGLIFLLIVGAGTRSLDHRITRKT